MSQQERLNDEVLVLRRQEGDTEAFELLVGRWQRQLIGRKAQEQTTLPFLSEHPIIRPLADYGRVIAAALARKAASGVRFQSHDWTEASSRDVQHNGPEGPVVPQGPAEMLPPRSGYPSSGCSPAEPDPSVSHHRTKENEPHE